MAKGAGMIHPVPRDDAGRRHHRLPARRRARRTAFLKRAVGESFNRISVDGECSTNDAVILLANGASGIERTPQTDREFAAALGEVCADLSRQIVMDGEGATVLLEVAVTGAASPGEAEAVARRIATSPLVKTAAFGRDPNWGRILAAAGSAFVSGGFAQVDVELPDPEDERRHALRATASRPAPRCRSRAPSAGSTSTSASVTSDATYLASDLTYDYVRINAEYTT